MPKQIVIEACYINYCDDAGGVFAAPGSTVEPNKDTAEDLARMGRTLYVVRADDPTKGRLTASDAMIKAAAELEKADNKAAAAATKADK